MDSSSALICSSRSCSLALSKFSSSLENRGEEGGDGVSEAHHASEPGGESLQIAHSLSMLLLVLSPDYLLQLVVTVRSQLLNLLLVLVNLSLHL